MASDETPKLNAAEVNEVKRRHQAELSKLPHVTGVGVGQSETGETIIKVYVGVAPGTAADPRPDIPQALEGVPVEVEFMKRPRKR